MHSLMMYLSGFNVHNELLEDNGKAVFTEPPKILYVGQDKDGNCGVCSIKK